MSSSPVTEFYRGKNLFITGGTGFVGLCLIEKLLRSFPDLKNIYLLLRPKKGKKIEERLEDLSKNSVSTSIIIYFIFNSSFILLTHIINSSYSIYQSFIRLF